MKNGRLMFIKVLGFFLILYFAQSLRSEKIFNDASDPILKMNHTSIVEGIPAIIDSKLEGNSFQWFKDGQLLDWETNSFIKINFPLNGDEGNYFVRTKNKGINFKASFEKNIRVFVNDHELENDRVEIVGPFVLKLVPFISGLPIRYSLDGSEPNESSLLYEGPIQINDTIRLRAKIEIPETDSPYIQVK